ncbi:MAG: T9SS type A sorting domain-containing protein [Bacteroidia bacterium]|nr:T9SS type A sorting domain-containing protein [Bacteroidia bacterium]MDW8159152.1 T9SS type A sorting domain-containing protein [Bacteroidia bacterium]
MMKYFAQLLLLFLSSVLFAQDFFIPTASQYCASTGSEYSIRFWVQNSPNFGINNEFILELSDENGNFANPLILGKANNFQNSIFIQFPPTLKSGSNYRFRIRSTAPSIIGTPSAAFWIVSANDLTVTVESSKGTTPCLGDISTLSVTPSIIGPSYQYQWVGPNNFSSTQQSFILGPVTSSMAGNYRATALLSGTNCFAVSTPFNLQPQAAPSAPLVTPISRCGGGLFSFTVQMGSVAGNRILLFTQANATSPIAIQTNSPYIFSANVTTSTTFWLEAVQTTNQCTSERISLPVTVERPPIPFINVTPSSNTCVLAPISISGPPGLKLENYIWELSDAFPSNIIGPGPHLISWQTSGTKTVKLTMRGELCPVQEVSTIVTVHGTSLIDDFTLPSSLCAQTAILLEAPSILGAQYTWDCGGCPSERNLVGSGPHLVSWLTPGTRTVSLRYQADNCPPRTIQKTITILPIPSVDINIQGSICAQEPVQVSFVGQALPQARFSWNWDGAIAIPGSGRGPHRVIFPQSKGYTISLTVEQNGCFQSASLPYFTLPPLEAKLGLSRRQVCENDTITIRGQVPTAARFIWDCDGCFQGTLPAHLGPHIISWGGSGEKKIRLWVQNQDLCTRIIEEIVTVLPRPRAEIWLESQPEPLATCVRRNISVALNNFFLPPTTSLSWDCDGCLPQPSTLGPHRISWATPGVKTISLQLSSANGCRSGVIRQNVTVHVEPDLAIFAVPNNVCPGRLVTLSSSILNNAVFSTVRWDCQGCSSQLSPRLGSFAVSWNTPGIKSVSLQVATPSCGLQTVTQAVIVHTPPKAPEISDKSRCESGTIVFTTSTVEEVSVFDENNIFVGKFSGTPPSLSIPFIQIGEKHFKAVAIDTRTSCVSDTHKFKATVFPLPSPPRIEPVSRCGLGPVTFTARYINNSGTQLVVQWYSSSLPIAVPFATGDTLVKDLPFFGEIYARVVNLQAECSSQATKASFQLNPFPTGRISALSRICTQEAIEYTFEGTYDANATFSWECDNCELLTPASGTSLNRVSVMWKVAGEQTIRLTVRNPSGCQVQFRHSTSVFLAPSAKFNLAAREICITQSLTLNAQEPTPGAIYTWNCDGCNLIFPQGAGPHTVTWSTAGTKTILLTATTPVCGTLLYTQIITINPLPVARILSPVEGTFCQNQAIRLEAESRVGQKYIWQCNGCVPAILPNTAGPIQIQYSSAGSFQIQLTVITPGCAPQSFSRSLRIHPLPPLVQVSRDTIWRCGNGNVTIAPLVDAALIQSVELYTLPTGGIPIQTQMVPPYIFTVPVTTPTRFYLGTISKEGGCLSDRRTSILVIPTDTLSKPRAQSLSRCGAGRVTFTALVTEPLGTELRLWQDGRVVAQVPVAENIPRTLVSPIITTNTNFIIEHVNLKEGCRAQRVVEATILRQLPLPLLNDTVVCGGGRYPIFVIPDNQVESRVGLYTLPFGGSPLAEVILPGTEKLQTPFITTTTTFFVENTSTDASCISSARVPIVITVLPRPVISFSFHTNPCPNGLLNLSLTIHRGPVERFIWRGPGSFEATTIIPTLTIPAYNNPSPVRFEAIAIAGNCTSDIARSQIVNLQAPPAIPIIRYLFNCSGEGCCACAGDSIRLSLANVSDFRAGTQFLWEGPNNFIQVTTLPRLTIAAEPTAAGFYTVTAINSCSSRSAPFEVCIRSRPPIPVVEGDGVHCASSSSAPITIRVTNPISEVEYRWSGTCATGLRGEQIQIARLSRCDGNYTVQAVHSNGCRSAVRPFEVKIVELPPTLNLQTLPEKVCEGKSFQIIAIPAIYNATYVWQTPRGSITQNTPTLNFSSATLNLAGTYQVQAFAQGCTTKVAVRDINVLAAPQIRSIDIPARACAQDIITLRATVSGPIQNWLWQGPEGFVANTPTVNLIAEPYLSGNYRLIVSASNGCADTASTLINVEGNRVRFFASVLSNTELCAGETLRFNASVSETNEPIFYYWQGPNNFSSTVASPTLVQVQPSNSGLYTVEARNTRGCIVGSATFAIKVNPVPLAPSVSIDITDCRASDFTLSVVSPLPNLTYRWEGPNNFRALGTVIRLKPESFPWGIYTVQALAENSCNSPKTQIEVSPRVTLPIPSIRLSTPSNLCEGDKIELNGISSISDATFFWRGPSNTQFIGKDWILEKASLHNAGIYSLQLIQGLCASPVAISPTVSVFPAPSLPVIRGPRLACENSLVSLGIENPIEGVKYLWKGLNSNVQEGNAISFLVQGNRNIRYEVEAVGANNCRSEVSIGNIEVISMPLPIEITASKTEICQGSPLLLEAASIGGASFEWTTPRGNTFNDSYIYIPNVTLADGGLYRLRVNALGCSSEKSILITVNNIPAPPTVGYNGVPCPGRSIQLFAQGPASYQYYWQGENFNSQERAPFVILKEVGNTYQVVAIEKGCTSLPSTFAIPIEPSSIQVTSRTSAFCASDSIFLSFVASGRGPWYANLDINGSFTRLFLSTSLFTYALPVSTPSPVVILQSLDDSRGCRWQVNQVVNIESQNLPAVTWIPRNCGEFAALSIGNIPLGAQWEVFYLENQIPKSLRGLNEGIYPIRASEQNTILQLQGIRVQTANRTCFQPLQGIFRIGQAPIAEIISSRQEVCVGQTATMRILLEGKGPWIVKFRNGSQIEERVLGNAAIEGRWETSIAFVPQVGVSNYQLIEVIDANGCRPSLRGSMVVTFRQPQVGFLNRSITACTGVPTGIPLEVKGKGPWKIDYLENNTPLSFIIPAQSDNTFIWQKVANQNLELVLIGVQDSGACPGIIQEDKKNIFITALPGPSIQPQILGNSLVCPGATLELSIIPVAGALNYVWQGPNSFSFTGQILRRSISSSNEAGTYSVTIIAPGCTSQTATRLVTLRSVPKVAVFPPSQEICPNETAEIEVRLLEGQLPWRFTYQIGNGLIQNSPVLNQRSWIFRFSPLQSTLFRIIETIELAGCTTQPGVLGESFIQVGGARCCPAPTIRSIEPNPTIEKALLRWNSSLNAQCYVVEVWKGEERISATLVPLPVDSLFVPLPAASMNYAVRLRSNCSLCSFSQGFLSSFTPFITYGRSAFAKASEKVSLLAFAYPNPTQGLLQVELPYSAVSFYRVMNLQGQVLLEGTGEEKNLQLELSNLVPGMYLLEVEQNQIRWQFKIIKQ